MGGARRGDKSIGRCLGGSKVGVVIARAITYLALHQGRDQVLRNKRMRQRKRKRISRRFSDEEHAMELKTGSESHNRSQARVGGHRRHVRSSTGLDTHHRDKRRPRREDGIVKIDIDDVAENIRKEVKRTARCIRNGLLQAGHSTRGACIHGALVKEAESLIDSIMETAALHNFKCDYEALRKGKCMDLSEKELEQGLGVLSSVSASF